MLVKNYAAHQLRPEHQIAYTTNVFQNMRIHQEVQKLQPHMRTTMTLRQLHHSIRRPPVREAQNQWVIIARITNPRGVVLNHHGNLFSML